MRILILHERGVSIAPPPGVPVDVVKNNFPDTDAISIVEDGKIPIDWSWPDYTVVVGTVALGRNKGDAHIDIVGDFNAQILQIVDSALAEYVEGEDDVE